ncbi:hypothetical protein C0J52_13662 [Blattella germanica]|nr:hypothetical protein C0J52_13662 [Blattella germanica]
MEAAPGVTEGDVCADGVNNPSCAISVTKSSSHKTECQTNNQRTIGNKFIRYNGHKSEKSECDKTSVPEENTAGCQDNAYFHCQEQVNGTVHVQDGGNEIWRLHNSFNLWRESAQHIAASNKDSLRFIDDDGVTEPNCRCSRPVLDVVCDKFDIESAFSKCCVLDENNASVPRKQIYSSDVYFDRYDDERDIQSKDSEDLNFSAGHLISLSNNISSFVFGQFTNLFQLSLRRIYPQSLGIKVGWEEMGNLQGSEKKGAGGATGKSPAKGKKEKGKKSPAKELLKYSKAPAPPPPGKAASQVQQKAVPPQGNVQTASSHAPVVSNNGTSEQRGRESTEQQPSGETTTYVVTDSWRHVKKLAIKTPTPNSTLLTPPSRDSSSESVFTDPLTPQGFAEAQNNNSSVTSSSYYSDPCSNGKVNQAASSAVSYFQNLTSTSQFSNGFADSVFTSLSSEIGMVGSEGGMGKSDKDKRSGSSSISATDLDDVTLTLLDSEGEEVVNGTSASGVQKRPQSHSLDALDEEEGVDDDDKKKKSRSADALEMTSGATSPGAGPRANQPPSSFTLVRHRKVELNPTRLSEHCLIAGRCTVCLH